MKQFFHSNRPRRSTRGFSLVEAVLSIGFISFGFLAMAPLLLLGLNGARQARQDRAGAHIAATLIEQAKQGTVAASTLYFDSTSQASTPALAAYAAQESVTTFSPGSATGSGPVSRLTIRVTPVGSAAGGRTYADVYATPPTP